MTPTHRHRAIPAMSKTVGFSGPIKGAKENRAAHGNICVIDRCRCGAIRRTNRNAGDERGPWIEPNPT